MATLFQARSPRFTALIILIVALAAVSYCAAPAAAQCNCTGGRMLQAARCWYSGPGSGGYSTVPSGGYYTIYCQARGGSVGGNNYWNRIYYGGRYCYVNDYYMTTGCATKCYNLGCCSGYSC